MSSFTPAGSGGLPATPATIQGASAGAADNVAITLANTEQSYVLPATTLGFVLKLRDSGAALKLAFTSGQSGVTFFTIPRGCSFSTEGLTLTGPMTLYFQATAAAQVLEIVYWTT